MYTGSNKQEISDLDCFEELFKSTHPLLCAVASRILNDETVAKDIVQEFFIKYWKMQGRFTLKVSFEAFAVRSVKNSCIDYLRRQSSVDRTLTMMPLSALAEDPEYPDEIPDEDRRLFKTLQQINKLPLEQKKVFEAHALGHLTYKQIAAHFGISVNTVKTHLKRAYSKLRNSPLLLLLCSLHFYFFAR